VRARIHVTLKPEVLDPQGAAVEHALSSLGFDEVSDVRVGRYIELSMAGSITEEQARERVRSMCDRLLANLVIEDYRLEITPS
jgi:phosphoribosylformylglycinamidine synthase PurS subunit